MSRLSLYTLATVLLAGVASALKNPLIPGWNPDAHVLRVEDKYYIAVSSFLTFPGVPIYESTDLSEWELISHAVSKPGQVLLSGVRTGNGIWAPSLSYIDGTFYMTSMSMTGSDPEHRTWPRIFWTTSSDLKTWDDEAIWAEPYGIDPHLYQDPASGKTYLTLMGLNNGFDQIWGITQCQVDLGTGKCVGPYRNTWNGTLPVTERTRPEGPKLFEKGGYYYMVIAEGGTGVTHRASVARSESPGGPWEESPTNPLLFNFEDEELTVSSTGHATFATTPEGKWFATFLARRNVGDEAVLGRETFFAPVDWDSDGWPVVNNGEHVKLRQRYPEYGPEKDDPPQPYQDDFSEDELRISWYQLRSPYTKNLELRDGGVVLAPNVYTLSDRDTPAAILRKQTSVNMTFSATLLPTDRGLGPYQSVGVSAYASGAAHQDLLVRGCANATGLCISVEKTIAQPGPGIPPAVTQFPLSFTRIPEDFTLKIRCEPRQYSFGYTLGSNASTTTWVDTFSPELLRTSFDGAMFALYASGNSFPWPFDAPEVGFSGIREEYFEEGFGDYKDDHAE